MAPALKGVSWVGRTARRAVFPCGAGWLAHWREHGKHTRSLYGELGFSTEALTPRQVALAQSGNAWKMAKHQVRTLVRTSVNATANAASQQVYKANPEVTKKYRWVATLDSRTSPICRNLDQSVYEYGKGPTPANPPLQLQVHDHTDHRLRGLGAEHAAEHPGLRTDSRIQANSGILMVAGCRSM